jgi:hypothetical protein
LIVEIAELHLRFLSGAGAEEKISAQSGKQAETFLQGEFSTHESEARL